MNIERNRRPRNAEQDLNDLLATGAFDRGDAHAAHWPVEVYLQVASACNLDCYMCYEHLRPPEDRHGRGFKSLDPELFERIAREVFPFSSRVTFGLGGEPMLSPHLVDFVERSHELNQHVHLMTNGTLIHNEKIAATLARCLSSIEVSVDGATAETYERIRVGASFERLKRNLQTFNRFRLEYPPEDRTHFTLCMVLMKSNVHELPLYVELCKELEVDRVAAWHVIPVTEESKGETLWSEPERANRYLEEARARAEELGIEVDFVRPFGENGEAEQNAEGSRAGTVESLRHLDEQALLEDEEAWERPLKGSAPGRPDRPRRLHCHMPTKTAFVFWNGRVYPCCHPHAHTHMEMGDLNEQSFAEIWGGRQFRNLRAGLAAGDVPPLCESCSIIHGPSSESEDAEALGDGADLAAYYGDRDLAPVEGAATDFVELATRTGLAAHLSETRLEALTLAEERRHLLGHIATLEAERAHLVGHLATLEAEREHLVAHNENMEDYRRELERIQGRPSFRLMGAVKDLVLLRRRPR